MARPKQKATITWLGEDHLHKNADGDFISMAPVKTTWKGIDFPNGEPVEVNDAHIVAKAKGNPFFLVDGVRGGAVVESDGD